jgi:hypothetical protein
MNWAEKISEKKINNRSDNSLQLSHTGARLTVHQNYGSLKMNKQYNVLFDIGFSIIANDERGETLKPSEIRYAIIRRAINICDDEIKEAVGFCDSYVVEEGNDD